MSFQNIDVIFPLPNNEVLFLFTKYRGCLLFSKIDIIFNLIKNWGSLLFLQIVKVVFHLPKYWGCLPFNKILSTSSICQNIEVVFHLPKYSGRLAFSKILSTSFICQNIEVVSHLPKYWGRLPYRVSLTSITSFIKQVLLWKAALILFRVRSGRVGSGWTTGTLIIELTQLNFKWTCQLELSLAIRWSND